MKTTKKKVTSSVLVHEVQPVFLEELHFDLSNPRYGRYAARVTSEVEALDLIVNSFGIEDLLSSLSVNGYFDSEPLVACKDERTNRIEVLEGNRRLAACLILGKDPRSANQQKLRDVYCKALEASGKVISPIPVIMYEGRAGAVGLLPYLGVRHIVGFAEWDSYAKAAWVHSAIKDNGLTLDKIMQMIGDTNKTTPRMLGGFYLVRQLEDSGHFNPKNSLRKGRGSNPDYPFSWVYTALDYKAIRSWIGFPESDGELKENPLPQEKLPSAAKLMRYLFGDKSQGFNAAIADSRNIGDLATVLASEQKAVALEKGKPISVIIDEARPAEERLHEAFYTAQEGIKTALSVIDISRLRAADAQKFLEPSLEIKTLANRLNQRIVGLLTEEQKLEGDG